MNNNNEVGKFIAKLRKEKGMSQEDLAEQLFFSRQLISKWERGLAIPTGDSLTLLAKALHVTEEEILCGRRIEKKEQTEELTKAIVEAKETLIKTNRKLKLSVIIGAIVIAFLLILFFGYYFLVNYNKVKVYTINGESDDTQIYNGIITVNAERFYFTLGKVTSGKDITKLTLYFKEDDEDKLIVSTTDTYIFFVDFYGYNEYVNFDNLDDILSNLYLEVEYSDDTTSDIYLEVTLNYTNSNLFVDKKESIGVEGTESSGVDNTLSSDLQEIEDLLLSKLVESDDGDSYNIEYVNGELTYWIGYFVDSKILFISISDADGNILYTYWYAMLDENFDYWIDDDTAYSYDLKRDNCMSGDCTAFESDYEWVMQVISDL